MSFEAFVDAELPRAIGGFVRRKALYNGDTSFEGYEPCSFFAITSYKDRAPTLKLLLDDGSLFSFMPIDCFTSLTPQETQAQTLDMEDLAYKNCPDYGFAFSSPKFLQGKINCYFPRRDQWFEAEYIASLDWHRGNLIMHICHLENGQIAILPSHKIKFHDGAREFKPYRKITSVWEVGVSGWENGSKV
ncbi:MAG: hypothetical protein LBF86_09655 [Helicobacteraceae bacterium]|jgi:hypothetical protein|nr:hypothetical protein [Helicobacteraceae bacterium]